MTHTSLHASLLTVVLGTILALTPACQSPRFGVPKLARGVELSEDGATAARLQDALHGLFAEVSSGALSSRWVDPTEQAQNDFFYSSLLRGAGGTTPLVLKSYPRDGTTYALTIALLPAESPLAGIPRIVEIEAIPRGSSYRFRSPFESRVARLASQTIGSVTFHYSGAFDPERAERFVRFKEDFEAATDADVEPLDYYCFHSLEALLRAYGLVHDASKCNFLSRDLGFLADDGRRYVTGTGDERYLFGYVRGVLEHRAPNPDDVYAPYANGIAAYYGGYALSGDSMETLAQQLEDELAHRPSLDFLEEFRKGRKSSVQRHFTYYVLCAFLFGEIRRRHGVQAALEGLESGADGASFFDFLETHLDVGESDFHELIVKLIRQPAPATAPVGP